MKRVTTLILAMMVVTLSLVPVTAQAGWASLTISKLKLEHEAAEFTLMSQWKDGLDAANALYENAFWALDYIDAWAEQATWDALACARAACILVSGYLDELECPPLSLSDVERSALVQAGVETNVLAEYSALETDRQEMHTFFRKTLLPRLDNGAIWADELVSVKELSASRRAYLQAECDSLRSATNYLLLPLCDQAEGEALMAELKETCPVIFPQDAVWVTDAKALEDVNVELSDEIFPAVYDEMDAALMRAISRDENAIMDMQEGRSPETLSIQGAPDLLPVPLWYDTELARFAVIRRNEDKTLAYPRCGDPLTRDDCNLYVQQTNVSLEQVEAYLEEAEPYAKAVSRKENDWTILMDGYSVKVSWANQTVTITFMGESNTMMSLL